MKLKFTVSNSNMEEIRNHKNAIKKAKEFGKINGFKDITKIKFKDKGVANFDFIGGSFKLSGKLEIINL